MKKTTAIIIAIIIFAIISPIFTVKVMINHVNSRTTVITSLDEENDIVYCTDWNGCEYSFYGCEDWFVGDYCSLILFDNFTPYVEDDIILKCRYDGWLEGIFGQDPYDCGVIISCYPED